MDKAPDAFRTISEVADDLDIPQHVLRFWETRFAQIKPMKRSGGRRYYRPDDVDLLKGIRRLLYGEGYTIRGVQRILKEHGIKSVQGLADGTAAVSFGAIEEAIGQSLAEEDKEDARRPPQRRGGGIRGLGGGRHRFPLRRCRRRHDRHLPRRARAIKAEHNAMDRDRLESVLQDLIACRQMLDRALKDG